MRSRTIRTLLGATAGLVLAGAASAQAAQILYTADGSGAKRSHLRVLDAATGNVVEDVGLNGFSITGLAQDPGTGIMYGATSRQDFSNPGFLTTIDKRTGAATLVGDQAPASLNAVSDITFTPDGTLYGWLEGPDDLVTIDKATGLATVVGDSGIVTGGGAIASDSTGNLFLAASNDQGPLRTVNPVNGVPTTVSLLKGGNNFEVAALAFDAQNTLFGISLNTNALSAAKLMTISTLGGAGDITYMSGFGDGLDALAFVDVQTRTISLAASKSSVKPGKNVVLSGGVATPDVAGCAAGVSVELLAKSGGAPQTPVATATTAADGSYSATLAVAAKTTFQASVSGPAFCQDALSSTVTVKTKKPKKR
jgi:hypothetical protein